MASGGNNKRLGAFEIVKDLAAKGAQGKLFVGRVVEPSFPGLEIGQLVALKVMPVHSDDAERQFRRLQRRTEALAAANHPGIVRYYGCFSSVGGFSEDIHVVVMELLKGQTLEERLSGNSLGLDADEVLKIIRTCVSALSRAAEHGIVHRDIKPSNIFLCEDGGVKLIDFEIARQDGASRTTTESGAMRGTVDYMAPDFHQDFRPDKSFRGDQCSDVFSLTVCLYEMLAGCRPYAAGGTLGEQSMMAYFQRWTRVPGVDVNRALKIEPYKIHALAHVQKVIKRGLSPERIGRYQTYFEFYDALRAVKLREIISPTARYQLLRCVGKGGFGVVFRARRVSDGMIVAIKCLLRADYSERFIREAKILSKFHDDRMVSFVEYFKTVRNASETFFIVMQFLEGMPGFSLRDRINGVKAGGRLPPREIAVAFKRFAEGLELLHGAGVIHRDIKPANLYMPPDHPEKACVMDLGVAKTDETQTNGSLPGTLDYMPPEMATGTSRGEPAVDIYALGLCLYEALTCKTAYPRLKRGGDGLAEFYKRAKSGTKPDLSGLDGSPMWRKLVAKMTDPDISRRIKTACEVVRLIGHIPDSELPDVREKSAGTADLEPTDNYVIPGSKGVELPEGETGESGESESVGVHVEDVLSDNQGESPSGEAEGAKAGTEPGRGHSPARTNAEAEEKLSAAIAEVERIVAAQDTTSAAATATAATKAYDGTVGDAGGQTLVLDATIAARDATTVAATAAAQDTTTAAVSATAATKAFDGTVGGQTLVLDATAAAQDTTTAAVSATAATKAFDGTVGDVGGQTLVLDATAAAQDTTTAAVSATAATKGFEETIGTKATAEPAVIITRPRRSKAPLAIAASLALCVLAGSLFMLLQKADSKDMSPRDYLEELLGIGHPKPVEERDPAVAETNFDHAAESVLAGLDAMERQVQLSDSPDKLRDELASHARSFASAWEKAVEAGATNQALYMVRLEDFSNRSNSVEMAIASRSQALEAEKRARIVAAERTFATETTEYLLPLNGLSGQIAVSEDPESFTNVIGEAKRKLDAAWKTAEEAGITNQALYTARLGDFRALTKDVDAAIVSRRQKLEEERDARIAAAVAEFTDKATKILMPLYSLSGQIATSEDPESFTNAIADAMVKLDAAWETARKEGVYDSAKYTEKKVEYTTLSGVVANAIKARRDRLDAEGEYNAKEKKYDLLAAAADIVADPAAYRKALADIDEAVNGLPRNAKYEDLLGKYEVLREKYGKLKSAISAPTAKIVVENEGDAPVSVTLGGRTETIAEGKSRTFDQLEVWRDYDIGASVRPPTGYLVTDYRLERDNVRVGTKGPKDAAVPVSFTARYKGDPKLIVKNDNAIPIKVNGIEIRPNASHAISGKPRTELSLDFICGNEEWKFKNPEERSNTVMLGGAGTERNIPAPTLIELPLPTLCVKMEDGAETPYVDWSVVVRNELSGELKNQFELDKVVEIPVGKTTITAIPRWKGHTLFETLGKWMQFKLEYGNFEETATARRGSNLVVRITPTRNAEAREGNVNILRNHARRVLLKADPDKDRERNVNRNVSEFASAVDALAILKNIYGEPVDEENRDRLEKLKGYDFVGPGRGETDKKEWARLEPVINDLLKAK